MGKEKGQAGQDLRGLLLDAALEILAEGDTPLDLRKVAERAGKSRTAPYLVFGKERDGGGLLALRLAVATEGTEMLLSAVRNAANSVSDPRAAFQNATEAFLTFASEKNRLFHLMFGSGVGVVEGRSSAAEVENLFGARLELESFVKELIEQCQEASILPKGDQAETMRLVLRAWMLLHGTAGIMLDGLYRLAVPQTIRETAELATAGVLGTETNPGLQEAAACLLIAQQQRDKGIVREELAEYNPGDRWPAMRSPPAKESVLKPAKFDQSRNQPWELARAKVKAQSRRNRVAIGEGTALRRAALVGKALEGSRVLWIDDALFKGEGFKSFEMKTLHHLGMDMTTAESTESAVDILGKKTFDLIISDIDRSGRPDEGVAAIPLLKEVAPNSPIVFYIRDFDEQRGIPLGSAGITNRPGELLHLVLDIIERVKV